jgi:hypothetical protein
MRNFVYVIGSTDDFSSLEELRAYFEKSEDPDYDGGVYPNFSTYDVSLSKNTVASGYKSLEEIATMLGRGEAMTDGWCLDDTVSFILEE